MGLGSRESSNTTFLSIFDGKIVREWRKKKPSEDQLGGKELKERKLSKGPNEGKPVWYVEFDYVAGNLHEVKLKTGGDYGAQLQIKLKDVDEVYSLAISIDSAYAQSFLLKMNNLDINEEVSFEPWSMDPIAWKKLTGKDAKGNKSGMTIRQNDEKIENFYTKDDPKGMPEIIIKKVRGETKVDSVDRDIFLDDRLKEFIKTLDGRKDEYAAPTGGGGRATDAPDPSESQNDEDYDDLPF